MTNPLTILHLSDLQFASEPENSRPASGEDLSFSKGTDVRLREGSESGENPTN
jgi:hypothetical protein